MIVYLISDTHFNHANIATYCDRPKEFTDLIIKNWQQIVKPEDCVIHLGDVFIGRAEGWADIYPKLPGRKILVRGNHDRQRSYTWWMTNGFDACCDSLVFRNVWLTHEPATSRAAGCNLNVHGHLHNIWHGFAPDGPSALKIDHLKNDWQRLFAVEYTNYGPIEFNKFIDHPERWQAMGPKGSKCYRPPHPAPKLPPEGERGTPPVGAKSFEERAFQEGPK
jgi:calcineurin-like phosphoesterase family protein